MTRLLNITQSTISCYYRAQASLSKSKAMTESVTLIQRFGGSKAKIDSLKSRASNDKKSHAKKSNRIPWANLLKRVFDIDITICPKCRGKVRIISATEDPAVISKILNHLGLPSTPPRLHPARGPPDCEQSDLFS
jgi:hypothetical protein